MIELKVRKIGNSLGVVLPKEAVARLNTVEGASVHLTEVAGGGYTLESIDPEFSAKMSRAEEIIGRYRSTLHVLAQ